MRHRPGQAGGHGCPDIARQLRPLLAALSIGPHAKRLRRNAAGRLLDAQPDLAVWRERPTTAGWPDLRRTNAWSLVTWCFLEGVLPADLDLPLAKTPGDLYIEWGQRHPRDVERVVEVASRFGWSDNWTRDVSRGVWAARTSTN